MLSYHRGNMSPGRSGQNGEGPLWKVDRCWQCPSGWALPWMADQYKAFQEGREVAPHEAQQHSGRGLQSCGQGRDLRPRSLLGAGDGEGLEEEGGILLLLTCLDTRPMRQHKNQPLQATVLGGITAPSPKMSSLHKGRCSRGRSPASEKRRSLHKCGGRLRS